MPSATEPDKISEREVEGLAPAGRINKLLSYGEPGSKRLTSEFIETQCKLKSIEVLSDSTAKATYTFKVTPFYCNGTGTLHGGASSMIFDICTSLTLMAIGKKDVWINGGVSRVLTVNYLRPAPLGEELELETEVVAAGKTMALLRAVMKRARDGAAVCTCEHSKVTVPSKPNWKL